MSRRTRGTDPTLVDGAEPTAEYNRGGAMRPVAPGIVPTLAEAFYGPPSAATLRARKRTERADRVRTARAITVDVSLILMCLILVAVLTTIAWRIWNREYFV